MSNETQVNQSENVSASIEVPDNSVIKVGEAANNTTATESWIEAVVREQRPITKENVKSYLKELESRGRRFEEGVLRKANVVLYQLLAECLSLAQLSAELDPTNARNSAINAFLKERKVRVGKDEPLFSKAITVVFGGVHRSRVSTYRAVLKAASKEKITSAELPKWIESQGGVQEIRVAASNTSAMSADEMSELTMSYLRDNGSYITLQNDALDKQVSIERNGMEVVLIATKKSDGTFIVNAAVDDAACIRKVLEVYQRSHRDAIKEYGMELAYRPGALAA